MHQGLGERKRHQGWGVGARLGVNSGGNKTLAAIASSKCNDSNGSPYDTVFHLLAVGTSDALMMYVRDNNEGRN